VRITHQWVERSASQPPSAPPAAIYPPDGGQANARTSCFGGLRGRSRWRRNPRLSLRLVEACGHRFRCPCASTSSCPNGDAVKEKDGGDRSGLSAVHLPNRACLHLTAVFLARRAKTQKGVWDRGARPGVSLPHALRSLECYVGLRPRERHGHSPLTPNPSATARAKYRVYGSDEKGFTMPTNVPKHGGDYQRGDGSLESLFPATLC